MLRLAECIGRPEVGPKAERLARARRLGLPVPDGVVVLPGETLDKEALAAALAGFPGDTFVVRSSAVVEDVAGRSGAGLFLSEVDVPMDRVSLAVAAVRRSGQRPEVQHYFGGEVALAVLIQPRVHGDRLGVLHLRRDGSCALEERPFSAPESGGQLEHRELPAGKAARENEADEVLLSGARALAGLLDDEGLLVPKGLPETLPEALIEYVRGAAGPVFLQVRPFLPFVSGPSWLPPPCPELTYRRDREHNPDPLSEAQAGLVEHVEGSGVAGGLRQCVRRGHLYYARSAIDSPGAPSALIQTADLPRRFAEEILPACNRLLAPLEAVVAELLPRARAGQPIPGAIALPEALSAYLGVYGPYVAQLAPSLSRARAQLDQFLLANLGEGLAKNPALVTGLPTITARRMQALWTLGRAEADLKEGLLAAYLERFGAFAPCWDVAAPFDDEVPERVLALATAVCAGRSPEERLAEAEARHHQVLAALLDRLPRRSWDALKALVPTTRDALAIAEEDDALFFRAQRVLRWALRCRGDELLAQGRLDDPRDVFHLPLVLDGSWGDLATRAAAARDRQEIHRRLVPPDQFEAGRPVWNAPPQAGAVLRGLGVPGVDPAPVRGRALVICSLDHRGASRLATPDLAGVVLVLPALLPSWAPFLLMATALVTDSGGALSHGATLAREAGVPAVLNTGTATLTLRDGDLVTVDAARGSVHYSHTGNTPAWVHGA